MPRVGGATAGRRNAWQYWHLQPVSRTISASLPEYVRRRAWTAPCVRFSNGISAVTSLCLVDETYAGGPTLLIAGDEDGGVAVQRVPGAGTVENAQEWSSPPNLVPFRLHGSCVNTIKLLPERQGFVTASDDGVLYVTTDLEAQDAGRVALHGHDGFVTDCDTASCDQYIVSSSTDGNLFVWDPVASNKPMSKVRVGRQINSVCFSPGEPNIVICAPERQQIALGALGMGDGGDDLLQIWDLRSLRTCREAIAASSSSFAGDDGVDHNHPTHAVENVEPFITQPQDTPLRGDPGKRARTSRISAGAGMQDSMPLRRRQVPSWLGTIQASPATPATPVQRSIWADDSSDADSPWSSRSLFGDRGLWTTRQGSKSEGKENCGGTNSKGDTNPPSPSPRGTSSIGHQGTGTATGSALPAKAGSDKPKAVLFTTSLPEDCLHGGSEGKSWVPGAVVFQWQPGRRRARAKAHRDAEVEEEGGGTRRDMSCALSYTSSKSHTAVHCPPPSKPWYEALSGGVQNQRALGPSTIPTATAMGCRQCTERASVFHVSVSADSREILTSCRDSTVTLWDAQTQKPVYGFGHPRLSLRARPVHSPALGATVLGRALGRTLGCGRGGGYVFAGLTDGYVRSWRVGSRFADRAYGSTHRHAFEVTCLAVGQGGTMFASADSSGKVCVQSAAAREDSVLDSCFEGGGRRALQIGRL